MRRFEHGILVSEIRAGGETKSADQAGAQIADNVAEYEELLEDLRDLAVIARRKDEPLIPLAEVKRRLKRNGRVRLDDYFRSSSV